jgi:hypothetical protein
MKAGTYYIGDLCYVLNDKDWSELCSISESNNKVLDGEFQLGDGRRFAIYRTAHGGGTYQDNTGREYWVESGTIGCILLSEISNTYTTGGHIVNMVSDFATSEDTGMIYFGGILIETNPDIWDEYRNVRFM